MAIKAHLERPLPVPPGSSQRRAPRRGLQLATSGFLAGTGRDGVAANVTIHNISAVGLLLETDLVLGEGEQLALDLPEAGAVIATVVWRSERLYGCAFAEALSPAALAAAQLQGLAPGVPVRPAGMQPQPGLGGVEGLGARLHRLRREAGLTLADVGAALGVSKPTVWAWEKGKARPLPERLGAIAGVLGVAPEVLAAAPVQREIEALITDCRTRIAQACGTVPDAVKIMIEL